MIILSMALIVAILGYGLLILPTQWLKVEQVHHSIGIGKKMMQLSDFHVERLRITPKQIQKALQKNAPDFICLTGDFVSHESALGQLKPYLEVIKESRIPCYAVLGNHDHKLKDVGILTELLATHNIQTLVNESIEFDSFYLIGIDDFCTGHDDIEKAFGQVGLEKKKVIITHEPNLVLREHLPSFDYLMAGHFHGRQINLPSFNLLDPLGLLMSKGIYKGIHHGEKGVFYISKGLGQVKINVRLFVRSEITIHKL